MKTTASIKWNKRQRVKDTKSKATRVRNTPRN